MIKVKILKTYFKLTFFKFILKTKSLGENFKYINLFQKFKI